MVIYNEKLVFDYDSYADVSLVFYDDGIGQGEIYIYNRSELEYHVIVIVEGESVSSYTETPRHVIEDAPCNIQRMTDHVANAMRAIMNKEVDFYGLH